MNFLKIYFIRIFCGILLNSVISASAQQLIFKTYTVQDGLVSNHVQRIYQDKKGFIWIGTIEGLSKYDGHKFINYTTINGLSNNIVNDIYEMDNGKLYVAENNGTVDILHQDAIVKKSAFSNVVINHFYTSSNNRVLAATDTSGIYEIKNGNLIKPSQRFPDATYYSIVQLNDTLLVGGSQGFLHILNRDLKFFSEIKMNGLVIGKIYKDSKSNIWVCTHKGLKLLSFDKKNNYPSNYLVSSAPFNIPVLKNNLIYDILEDADGNLWIATLYGLVKIDPDGSWQLFTEKNGLPTPNIRCLYQDREKNIWIGTFQGLVKLVKKNDIRTYTTENGLTSNRIRFLRPLTKDKFLIGTEKSIQLFNKVNRTFSSAISPYNFFYSGFVKNSSPLLFYKVNHRFGNYDSTNGSIVNYNLPGIASAQVYCSVMDSKGFIFNGTEEGLIIFYANKSYYETKLPYAIFDMLVDKKGYLWIATRDNGLYRIDYSNSNHKFNLTIKNFTDLLPDKHIYRIFEDSKSNIWVGTRFQGITQLENKGRDEFKVQNFNLENGLMSNWITAISEDNEGCMWIGSSLGIDKLIPSDTSFSIFNFSRVNNYFANINAILTNNDNSLWLATNTGLVNIYDDEAEKTPPPRVYITSVALGDITFDFSKHSASTKVYLKYNQNSAGFDFSSPGFINEKQNLFSYRLLGSADTTWSVAANVHTVSYASLQPGDYRFEVRTKGWNGQLGIPTNFNFYISPPFWQTWWFYSLIITASVLLFYGFYLYRVRQIIRLHKVRNRIATDLHDDIGSTLTNINMLSEISRKNLGQPQEAEKYLHRITQEVTATSQALNDIIWSINYGNDSIQETMTRMRRYAAELFDNSNTILHMKLDENIAEKKMNIEQRKDVYLIYKECLNNIVKHAVPINVWINIYSQNEILYLKIRDDGKGFDPSLVTNRNGLKNIRFRAEKWKGSTNIKAEPGIGTLIEIIIPLK